MTVYTVGLEQARKSLIRAISKKRVPMLKSSPGLGKSSLIKSIADEFELELIDFRLTQALPEDFAGLPMRDQDRAIYAAFKTFPIQGDKIPAGKKGWLLFFDEANSGTKAIQAASYKVILDRYVGMHKLHDNVFIACAGNKETDRAIVTQMGTAMQSRLVHYELAVNPDEYLEIFAKLNFDYRVQGFLEWKKDLVHNFNPSHTENTFPCPRTWEFASDMIEGVPTEELFIGDVSGCVGDGAATEFMAFTREYGNLPKYSSVIADPLYAPVPKESSTRFAMLSVLMSNDIEQDIEPITKYLERYDPEFMLIFLRNLKRKLPDMMNDPFVAAQRKRVARLATGRGVGNAVAA